MKQDRPVPGQFTGRHMLALMIAFFGVIIAVNVTMAVMANTSWTGLVVTNSYIASQQFNGRAEAGRKQDALGWSAEVSLADGALRFSLEDAEGEAVRLTGGTAEFRRPVSDSEDRTVALVPAGAGLEAAADIADGAWIVEILAEAGLDHPYRETRRVHVRAGAFR